MSFDEGCGIVQEAAEGTQKSVAAVASQARALQKAARTGDLSNMKRARDRLSEAVSALQEAVANTEASWPFQEENQEQLFGDEYVEALKAAVADKGLTIYERDGLLFSYPSLVRVLPGDQAVRIDKRKVSTVRPSHLAEVLLANQKRSSGFKSDRFLESLYAVYNDIVGEQSKTLLSEGSARVIPLMRIYKLMTALPGAARDYDRSDFARDLYLLDSNGPRETKKGAVVSFPSSTGARRRSSDLFSFIGPNGEPAEYYGLRFSRGET